LSYWTTHRDSSDSSFLFYMVRWQESEIFFLKQLIFLSIIYGEKRIQKKFHECLSPFFKLRQPRQMDFHRIFPSYVSWFRWNSIFWINVFFHFLFSMPQHDAFLNEKIFEQREREERPWIGLSKDLSKILRKNHRSKTMNETNFLF